MTSDKQIILITGANNGIGLDTSYALAAASPNYHIIMAVRSLAKGGKARAELQSRNPQGSLSLLELDVTNDEQIAAAAKKIESDFGRLDILVNNAGIVAMEVSRDTLRSTFETNVFGPMLLTQALLPLLKKSKNPKVINVTSELGSITQRADPKSPYYKMPADMYRMSKAALNMLAMGQQATFSEFGGKVWAYCPGYVITDLTGAEDRQNRKDRGAESSETSAQGILEVVEGKRDAEAGCFIARYGKQSPW
ncbi:short chain dehydrogenase [Massariosphaeria phaeospora]|uniref:Short chain dehydrogenase n=1 Tax=Massariosphaeria phaeospora TaxID=100035 RepID=A0A7C8HYD4_9PLEO|nr:short chain dehydrogenase [Massariosphaeria phaeospora]